MDLQVDEMCESLADEVKNLRKLATSWGLTNQEINECINSALNDKADENHKVDTCKVHKNTGRWVRKCIVSVLVCIVIAVMFLCCTETGQRLASRHVQGIAYPVMRRLRLIALPVLQHISSLSLLYDKQCLLENPLYREPPIDCFPCQDVQQVLDLTGFTNFSELYQQGGTPFLVQDAIVTEVSITNFTAFYSANCDELVKGTVQFDSSDKTITTLDDLFRSEDTSIHDHLHIEWKVKRAAATRAFRALFPRLYFVPNTTEVSLEKFVFIDGHYSEPYELPRTEFTNVWIAQVYGYRRIALLPCSSCMQECKVMQLVLQPKEVMYYNTQYWQPISLPHGEAVSITYLGSFY